MTLNIVHLGITRNAHGGENYTPKEWQVLTRQCQWRGRIRLDTEGVVTRRRNARLNRITVLIWKWLQGIRISISWLKPRGIVLIIC